MWSVLVFVDSSRVTCHVECSNLCGLIQSDLSCAVCHYLGIHPEWPVMWNVFMQALPISPLEFSMHSHYYMSPSIKQRNIYKYCARPSTVLPLISPSVVAYLPFRENYTLQYMWWLVECLSSTVYHHTHGWWSHVEWLGQSPLNPPWEGGQLTITNGAHSELRGFLNEGSKKLKPMKRWSIGPKFRIKFIQNA